MPIKYNLMVIILGEKLVRLAKTTSYYFIKTCDADFLVSQSYFFLSTKYNFKCLGIVHVLCKASLFLLIILKKQNKFWQIYKLVSFSVNGQRSPTISYISQTQILDLGGIVELKCSVQYTQSYSVIWMKLDNGNSLPISTGSSLILHDSRFSLRHDQVSIFSYISLFCGDDFIIIKQGQVS